MGYRGHTHTYLRYISKPPGCDRYCELRVTCHTRGEGPSAVRWWRWHRREPGPATAAQIARDGDAMCADSAFGIGSVASPKMRNNPSESGAGESHRDRVVVHDVGRMVVLRGTRTDTVARRPEIHPVDGAQVGHAPRMVSVHCNTSAAFRRDGNRRPLPGMHSLLEFAQSVCHGCGF